MAANNDVAGEVFNVGGGSRISVNELIEEIEDIIGEKANIKYVDKQKGDVRDTLADVSKANKQLHWTPKVISDGLKNFVEWLTSNKTE